MRYIVVGDNNFWYESTSDTDKSSAEILAEIKDNIKNGYYDDADFPPFNLFIFEAKAAGTLELEQESDNEEDDIPF